MTHYLFTTIGLSVLALFLSSSLITLSARMKLYLCILAMCAWFVPWQMIQISNDTVPASVTTLAKAPLLAKAPVEAYQTIESQLDTHTFVQQGSLDYKTWFIVFCSVGFLWFLSDLIKSYQHLRQLRKTAYPKKKLFKNTYLGRIKDYVTKTKVWVITDSSDAFTSGIFKPSVWIGEKLLSSDNFACVLQHEFMHVKNKDNVLLLFSTFTQRIFWWNPLVYALASQTRKNIEFSCDEQCLKENKEYDLDLAELLLQKIGRNKNAFALSIFGKRNNINRKRIERLAMYKNISNSKLTWLLKIGAVALAAAIITVPVVAKKSSGKGLHRVIVYGIFDGMGFDGHATEWTESLDDFIKEASKLGAEYRVAVRGKKNETKHVLLANSKDLFVEIKDMFDDYDKKRFNQLVAEQYDETKELLYKIDITDSKEKNSLEIAGKQNQWVSIQHGDVNYKVKAIWLNEEHMVDLNLVHASGEKKSLQAGSRHGETWTHYDYPESVFPETISVNVSEIGGE